jgi:hypothetical protein
MNLIWITLTCSEEIVSVALLLSDNASASWASKLSKFWKNRDSSEARALHLAQHIAVQKTQKFLMLK